MIKQLKFSLKIMKYGYGFKLNIFSGIAMFLLSLAFQIFVAVMPGTFSDTAPVLGAFLLTMSGMFLVQILMTFNSTGMFLASPRSRATLYTLPVTIINFCTLAGFTFALLLRLILKQIFSYDQAAFCKELYLLANMLFWITIYAALAYHYFISSMILFSLCVFINFFIGSVYLYRLQAVHPDSAIFTLPVTVGACYGILLIGCLLNWLCTLLVYKKPISKLAQGAALRKYL